jgi:serine/threonine protein phosphatase 1
MRELAVGDIHGCFSALETLAEFVPFGDDDLVITLGDYVNRGPDTCAVIDWLIERERRGKLIAIRGNHDETMMLARESESARKRFFENGGAATLASYSLRGDEGRFSDIPRLHWDFLERTRPFHETEKRFYVHGNVDPKLPLAQQPDYMLYWAKFDDPPPHRSGKTMICGHASQKDGLPKSVSHAVCIDTWACGRGWLTCLDPDTGRYWQANQKGETRKAKLEDLK